MLAAIWSLGLRIFTQLTVSRFNRDNDVLVLSKINCLNLVPSSAFEENLKNAEALNFWSLDLLEAILGITFKFLLWFAQILEYFIMLRVFHHA